MDGEIVEHQQDTDGTSLGLLLYQPCYNVTLKFCANYFFQAVQPKHRFRNVHIPAQSV